MGTRAFSVRAPAVAALALGAPLLAGSSGCATSWGEQTVCAEYRNLVCLTRRVCEYSDTRGCRICVCEQSNEHVDDPNRTGTKLPPPR